MHDGASHCTRRSSSRLITMTFPWAVDIELGQAGNAVSSTSNNAEGCKTNWLRSLLASLSSWRRRASSVCSKRSDTPKQPMQSISFHNLWIPIALLTPPSRRQSSRLSSFLSLNRLPRPLPPLPPIFRSPRTPPIAEAGQALLFRDPVARTRSAGDPNSTSWELSSR